MYQLHIRQLAKEDIQGIIDFYDKNASKLITDRFLESLFINLEHIK